MRDICISPTSEIIPAICATSNRFSQLWIVEEPMRRFELLAGGLQNRCSTTELHRHDNSISQAVNRKKRASAKESRFEFFHDLALISYSFLPVAFILCLYRVAIGTQHITLRNLCFKFLHRYPISDPFSHIKFPINYYNSLIMLAWFIDSGWAFQYTLTYSI